LTSKYGKIVTIGVSFSFVSNKFSAAIKKHKKKSAVPIIALFLLSMIVPLISIPVVQAEETNYGRTTIGSSWQNMEYITGWSYGFGNINITDLPSTANVNAIVAYLNATGGDAYLQAALYTANPVLQTKQGSSSTPTLVQGAGWYMFNFSTPISITNGTYGAALGNSTVNNIYIAYDNEDVTKRYYDFLPLSSTWHNDGNYGNTNPSIYIIADVLPADTTAPTISAITANQTVAGYGIKVSATVTDNILLNDTMWSIDNGAGAYTNQSWQTATNPATFTTTANSTVGVTFKAKLYARDSSGNIAVSDEYSHVLGAFDFAVIRDKLTVAGKDSRLSSVVTGVAPSFYVWSIDNGNGFVNQTWQPYAGNPITYSVTWNSTIGTNVSAILYANHTSGYVGASATWSRNLTDLDTFMTLHTEGTKIINGLGDEVQLVGTWTGMFADSSTGWFSEVGTEWDEADINYTLNALSDDWNTNVINFFFWGDWFQQNLNTTLSAQATPIGTKDAMARLMELAYDRGMYIEPRVYGKNNTIGRTNYMPFEPYCVAGTAWENLNWEAGKADYWSRQELIDLWVDVATTLNYSNVILHLYDEPAYGNATAVNAYYSAVNDGLTAIRGNGSDNLITFHYGFCGSMSWIGDYVGLGYNTTNVIFSEHIYRDLGSFAYDSNYPIDMTSLRNVIGGTPDISGGTFNCTGTVYYSNLHNVPVWVSATSGSTTINDAFISYVHELAVLNEYNIGYVVYSTHRTETGQNNILLHPTQLNMTPNAVGQELIYASYGILPNATYTVSVTSEDIPVSVPFTLGSSQKSTNATTTVFSGSYTVTMPSNVSSYTHHVLNGTTGGESNVGSGYSTYIYFAGTYNVTEAVTVDEIYLFATKTGKAKVAIYNASGYNPTTLIVNSSEIDCTVGYNLISLPSTLLSVGSYQFGIKIDTSGMLVFVSTYNGGKFKAASYSNDFPDSVVPDSGLGANPGIYIPTAPYELQNYSFSKWDDDSTSAVRSVSITEDTNLTAYYTTEATTYTISITPTNPQNDTYTNSTIPNSATLTGNGTSQEWHSNVYNLTSTSYLYAANLTSANTTVTIAVNGTYRMDYWASDAEGSTDTANVTFTIAIPPETTIVNNPSGAGPISGETPAPSTTASPTEPTITTTPQTNIIKNNPYLFYFVVAVIFILIMGLLVASKQNQKQTRNKVVWKSY
jgi:hypothetical protein